MQGSQARLENGGRLLHDIKLPTASTETMKAQQDAPESAQSLCLAEGVPPAHEIGTRAV